MAKKTTKKTKKKAKKKHGRSAMVSVEGMWTLWKFQADLEGNGMQWHRGRSCGPGNNSEKTVDNFKEMGYAVIPWDDSV